MRGCGVSRQHDVPYALPYVRSSFRPVPSPRPCWPCFSLRRSSSWRLRWNVAFEAEQELGRRPELVDVEALGARVFVFADTHRESASHTIGPIAAIVAVKRMMSSQIALGSCQYLVRA